MQAIILAGGKGTRLKPYTVAFPKPLVPVGDWPILEVIIRQLARCGVERVTVLTGHLAELIEAYFGNGSRWNVKMEYVREHAPLNTAGALKLVENCDEDFLVMNGDILTSLDYGALFNRHCSMKVIATVATRVREAKIDFGVVETNPDGLLIGYQEKPVYTFPVSMGVYVLNRRCKDWIADGESLGMPNLLLRLVESGQRVFCYRSDAYWLDIGRLDDYEQAQREFESKKSLLLAPDGS
ncbi:MAG: sugar phosphate nucleotidyltransferase [Acidobacteriota bacterium]|nr:sugar phosphate nucleotidyltransferase [Acidobacteriota bacterium]